MSCVQGGCGRSVPIVPCKVVDVSRRLVSQQEAFIKHAADGGINCTRAATPSSVKAVNASHLLDIAKLTLLAEKEGWLRGQKGELVAVKVRPSCFGHAHELCWRAYGQGVSIVSCNVVDVFFRLAPKKD